MTEDGIRTRRNLPAETWAVVRDAYLGGETAESIGRRLGLSVNTIRKRASRCGWTHSAHAKAMDRSGPEGGLPKVDPHQARRAAVAQAAALIAAGRGAEAGALLKAAEVLGRMAEADVEPPSLSADEDAAREAAGKAAWQEINREVERRADTLARAMLTDDGNSLIDYGRFALRWRTEVLGPEIAAQDRARHERDGTAGHYWDQDGEMRTQEAIDDASWNSMQCTVRGALGLPPARPGQG